VSRLIVSTSAYYGENHEQGVHLRIAEHLDTQIVTDKYPPGTILSTEAV
jgi:DNA-binding FadR family transcriptional regulator